MHREWQERVEKETGRTPQKLARPLPGGIPVDPLFIDLPPGPVDDVPGTGSYARGAAADPSPPRSCPRIEPARPDAVSLVEEAAHLGVRAFWVDGEVTPELAAAIERVGGEIVGGLDPLGELVRTGAGSPPPEEVLSEGMRSAGRPGGPRLVASGLPYDEAGADPARQLAYAVATGIFYLRRLEEAGLSTGDAADRIGFRLAVGGDVITSIALLRAARVVWAKVRAAGGAPGSILRLHAVSSARELTRRDPWVNVLRGTSQAFAALAGGADWITVLPFDEPVRVPEAAARRLALNTLTVLDRECFVGAVVDPAGGSWAIEHLTDRLARAAWDEVRAIEAAGGMVDALRAGDVRRRVDDAWAARARDLGTRRSPLTGVSEFADPTEAALPGAKHGDASRSGSELRSGSGSASGSAPGSGAGLPFPRRRDDDAYHSLRSVTDALAAGPGRPAVFLANLGPSAEHRPRTGFALNFFRVGGFDLIESPSAGDVPAPDAARALADAFRASGAEAACLCGSDERYTEAAAPVAKALRQAGAAAVLLAGRPEGRAEIADGFAFLGCDVPGVLGALLERLTAEKGAR